jgi:hypothetical protein
MRDVLIGLVAVAAGLLFCFAGYVALRVIIPIWGAVSGFFIGAGLVASFGDERYLRTLLSWVVGLAVGIVFGALAYLYYEVSVALAMSAVGFTLATGAMVAIGVSWSWVIVLVGTAAGLLLAVAAIAADLPLILLIWLSALAGAVTAIGGLMLIVGTVDLDGFRASTTDELHDSWGWYVGYVALVVAGLVVQLRGADLSRRSMARSWEGQAMAARASSAPR